jgi:tetratricopeptide (TPR) repeat protein
VPAIHSIVLKSFSALTTLLLVSASASGLTDLAVSDVPAAATARALVLTAQPGNTPIDHEIARLQQRIRSTPQPEALIVQLGWAFVSKARITGDPGYYKIAEQCSELAGQDSDSLLLQGHISHALHRFSAAEATARKLTADKIPRWQTYALLGDALMEQGKLVEAVDAYQRMIDIRPCLQTYARVAHMRWLKGDLAGAEELMRLAVEAGNSRDPEPAAWAYTRLALYQFQSHELKETSWSIDRALEFVKDYPAALYLRSKLEIGRGEPVQAVESLRHASAQIPLPEYQWALADAARLIGDNDLAVKTEQALNSRGAVEDPRSFALFLATRHAAPDTAQKLAQDELSNRRDVMTYDAVAWSALAAGQIPEARENMKRALAEGTHDARLFYHAAKIEAASGDKKLAIGWIRRAAPIQQMLLPSEHADLATEAAALGVSLNAQTVSQPTKQKLADTAKVRKQ